MSVGAAGDEGQGGVAGAIAVVGSGLADLAARPLWGLVDDEVRHGLTTLTELQARLDAEKARFIRESVAREAPDTKGRRGAVTAAVLNQRCRVGAKRARADVATAQVTCPDTGDLRALGAAWAAGEVTREHVDVARRTLTRIPRRLVREHRADVDRLLTAHAAAWDPQTADGLATYLLNALVPDADDRFDEHAHERRHLGVVVDSTGMVLVDGQLDPAAGSTFVATLDHLAEADRHRLREDGDPDLRTRGQRRADALTTMAELAAEHLRLPSQGTGIRAAVPRVVVHVTPDAATTTTGVVVTDGTLARMVCDAVVDRVTLDPRGRVQKLETLGRLAATAQRIALAARDHGCVWPGCTAPPSLCEAHHVVWWSRGGPTTLDNLALLCARHHTQVHAQPELEGQGWRMLMRGGHPVLRPPDRLGHPPDVLLRNTFHDTAQATRATGRRWSHPEPEPP